MTTTTSITNSLGVGSGVDIGALVQSLVENSFAVKNSQLTAKSDKLTAQISGVAKLKSGITGFDAALRSLVKGGTLSTQPTSSNAAVLTATALPGAKVGGLSASIRVETLAAAQAATSTTAVARTAGFAAGTLAITMGATSSVTPPTATLTIAAGATLDQIATQINDQKLGLTATVIGDGNGARLTIKGATGASQAFAIQATDAAAPATGTPSLQTLAVNAGTGGMAVGTEASDAVIYMDGARFTRSSNTISNLVPGVKLTLQSTSATAITLGTAPATTALGQAVSDFVATYNDLLGVIKEENDPVTGVLRSDSAVSTMARTLATLTTVPLAASTVAGAPRTLADLGVGTNRDGTLKVDTARLSSVLTDFPDAVEAMFADGNGATNGGLSAALGAIATKATDRIYGLDATSTRLVKQQADVSTAQGTQTSAAAKLKERLTQQYAAMDAKVAAYKSTGTFLTNQIAAWNKSTS